MNKIFKLGFSENKEDLEIQKILVAKDEKLQKHFYNIALYLGPRDRDNTAGCFLDLNNRNYLIYRAVFECLPEDTKNRLWKIWKGTGMQNKCWSKTGRGYRSAIKSFKILMEEK